MRLMNTNIMWIRKETIVFDPKVRTRCTLPYENHPQGCPNWDTCALCPPKSPYRVDILQKYTTFALVYVIFDLKTYLQEQRIKRPQASEKQLKCCLYWQNSLKKELKKTLNMIEYDLLLGCGSGFFSRSMESAGINVYQTLENNKIEYEIHPKTKIILCCLICLNRKVKELSKYGNSER